MNAIEIKNLHVAYGKTSIIKHLNLTIPTGKITIIIGPNGCGKSTLLKTIGRVLTPKEGEIFVHNKTISKEKNKDIAKEIAFLPQSPATIEGLKVRELIAYGRFPYQKAFDGLNKKDLEIIDWAMKSTGVFTFSEKEIDTLSGGQRQRAWIAMVLAQKTNILLLDEPTTYLDISYQLEILQLLQKINRDQNITIVLVLHELSNACRFADNIIGMKDGNIVFQGKPNDVITSDHIFQLYGVHAQLQKSKENDYPVLVDYNF